MRPARGDSDGGCRGDVAVVVVPIVALDVSSMRAAMRIVDELKDSCRFYKVGSELFTVAGPQIVNSIRAAGCDVFLDLKFHDIPNTVAGAVRGAAEIGAKLVTVHASGGEKMLAYAVKAAGERCGVLAVTVLTSFDSVSLGAAWGRKRISMPVEVMRLAETASAAGAHGIVCSGREAKAVQRKYGDRLKLLVPGIRLPGDESHDQARTVTPQAAKGAGASYVVVGRTVTGSTCPAESMARIVAALAAP